MAIPSPVPHDWGIAPCLDLINSRWRDHLGSGRVYDRLPNPVFRRALLERWHYDVEDPDDAGAQARLGSMRTLLRGLLEQYLSGRRLGRSMQRKLELEINRAEMAFRLSTESGGYALSIQRSGAGWDLVTSDIAMSAARLIADGALVKQCANPSCTWMFVDETRSGTRRWCNVSICGSLINVRRHRAQRLPGGLSR